MSFKSNNYLVIKEALDSNVANFIYQYFSLKKQVARTLFDSRYISQFTSYWGVWSDPQAPETAKPAVKFDREVMHTPLLRATVDDAIAPASN